VADDASGEGGERTPVFVIGPTLERAALFLWDRRILVKL
jgi:hypothetical protein